MVALSLTDEIARWVGIDSVTTMKAGTPVWAASATELARRGESFRYLILRGGEFAGVIEVRPDREAGNIGYWLRRRARGRGTATLANHVALLVAFDGLGLDAVEWTANGENDRSIAVMERLGATFVDRRPTPDRADRSSEVRYRLARSAYRHLPDGPPSLDVILP
jgi:RimJ/RimL family protein N-acetyltransferase